MISSSQMSHSANWGKNSIFAFNNKFRYRNPVCIQTYSSIKLRKGVSNQTQDLSILKKKNMSRFCLSFSLVNVYWVQKWNLNKFRIKKQREEEKKQEFFARRADVNEIYTHIATCSSLMETKWKKLHVYIRSRRRLSTKHPKLRTTQHTLIIYVLINSLGVHMSVRLSSTVPVIICYRFIWEITL